jgi:putative hemolysin
MNEILIAILLLVMAGIAVCAETAVISLGRHKVHRLSAEKHSGARSLQVIYRSVEDFVYTSKIVTLFFLLLVAANSGLLIVRLLEPFIRNFSNAWTQSLSYPVSMIITGILLIIVIQIFVYQIPRAIGQRFSERIALKFAPVLRWMVIVLSPVITLTGSVGRLFSKSSVNGHPSSISKAELLYFIEEGKRSSIIDTGEYEIINRVLEFTETTAKEIMIPRPDVVALEIDTPHKEIIKVITEEGFSRIPVYKDTIDNVVGILFAKDLIRLIEQDEKIMLENNIRPASFVPETKKISQLLREFQQQKIHLAIVIDEFGGTEGIITLEDIIEEIVGEIHDEYDEVKLSYTKDTDGTWIIDGGMSISDFNRTLSVQVPEDVDYETVNGFLHKLTGRIPEKNEEIQFGNLSFIVMRKSERRIEKIKVKRYHQTATQL